MPRPPAVERGSLYVLQAAAVETGRSTPSREMVLNLARHLDVPLREQNTLLQAAGFAAVHRETPLQAAVMVEVRTALEHILNAVEPNPSFVVNRRYDLDPARRETLFPANAAAREWLAERACVQERGGGETA